MLLAQIFTSMKLNVLPELIQEHREKKKEKKWRPESLNPFHVTLISRQTTKSQTTSKEEAVADSHWFLAYQKVFELSWIFFFQPGLGYEPKRDVLDWSKYQKKSQAKL